MPNVHKLLADMIDAYDSGDGTDDMRGFIAGWAETIAPAPTGDAPEVEVLVTGDPFDGLTVEGPYPRGFLGDCDITVKDTWWIVNIARPTIT